MATLKGVSIKKLNDSLEKINKCFKELKTLLKNEIVENSGELSYDRFEEYDNLFSSLKRVKLIEEAFVQKESSINLEGDELDTFCSKIGLSKDDYFKHQVVISQINKFDLNKYIEGIRESIGYNPIKTNSVKHTNKIKELEKLAYVDNLSGLFNRTKYEEVVATTVMNPNFGVIFFDLNYLKKTNDALGHDKGDLLIKSFSDVLKKSKTGKEDIYRIGGDEFVVLFMEASKKNIGIYENAFRYNIDQFNAQNELQLSSAYGIAYARENPSAKMIEIIKMADERMYKMKKEMKAERED